MQYTAWWMMMMMIFLERGETGKFCSDVVVIDMWWRVLMKLTMTALIISPKLNCMMCLIWLYAMTITTVNCCLVFFLNSTQLYDGSLWENFSVKNQPPSHGLMKIKTKLIRIVVFINREWRDSTVVVVNIMAISCLDNWIPSSLSLSYYQGTSFTCMYHSHYELNGCSFGWKNIMIII